MKYSIIVLAKQVPDTTAVTARAMKKDGTLNRTALPAVFNPEDLNALEMALQIKERFGASICTITMGPPSAAEILRQALYRGVDRVVLVTDRRFAASDTLATSAVLSRAIQQIGTFDLVLCGRQAIDGNTAQVGPQVAEKLDINQLTYVEKIEQLHSEKISVWRDVERGKELAAAKLPVLLTVTDRANLPRPPSAKKIMHYKKARAKSELTDGGTGAHRAAKGLLVEEWDADSLGIDPAVCGLSGSPTRVKKIESVIRKGKTFKKIAPTDEGINELLQELIQEYSFD